MTAITLKTLQSLCPNTPALTLQSYVDHINKACVKYQINTKKRLAMFLAQVAHESGEFKATKENLNYSEEALLRVFPKYFKDRATAAAYARKPELIANKVYANRMGNGGEASGDGWRYRGRGLIQLTGKNNYLALAKDLGKTLAEVSELMETTEGAAIAAGWYWNSNGLNAVADTGDFVRVTKLINGGTIGLEHRTALYNKALAIL